MCNIFNIKKINELLKDLPFSLNEVKIGEISTLWDLKNLNISVTLKDFNVILLIEDKQLGIFFFFLFLFFFLKKKLFF